ncbi:hypothetical protein JCM10207_003824, partial [Rhodosporidiobolus poonsookiae]
MSLFPITVRRALPLLRPQLTRSSSFSTSCLLLTPPSRRAVSLFPFQTPFTSLIDSAFSNFERDLERTAALLDRASFASDPTTQELLQWTHDGPTGDQKGAGTYRSVEVVKRKEGDGGWKVDVYAQDAAAPADSPLKEGKLIASGEGADEQEAVKQAAEKALGVIREAGKAIEGAEKEGEKKAMEGGDKQGGFGAV